MTEKHPKRPRDLNQWAKHMVDLATGEASDAEPATTGQGKDATKVRAGLAGGAKGGTARAERMTPDERSAAAKKAAAARWKSSDA